MIRTGSAGVGVLLMCLLVSAVGAQISLDEITANDEFRWGVGALHDGKINEAIDSLNRSLSLASGRLLTRYWLGRAYYYAGFEQAALDEWRWVGDREWTSMLGNWIERVELGRGLTAERLGTEISPGRYVTMIDLAGVQPDLTLFRRPTTIRPSANGSFYITSFGTHTVVLLDPNGVRRRVIDGGLEGFDRPFDVLAFPDGSLLVSEFGANRIARVAPNGTKTGSFGSRGIGEGQLLGPQFMAGDDRGHVYVSDHGNGRVSKFTTGGEFLFSFGGRGSAFGRFTPAGIVVADGHVYVADTDRSRIVVFDESGNHLDEIRTPGMNRPEGLSLFAAGRLLVSDRNRVYVVDVHRQTVAILSELGPNRHIVGSAVDANRNLVAADIDGDSVLVLAASEDIYTGLNVEIDFVNAREHPRVFAAVTVTDRHGNPVLGLGTANFRITEDRFDVGSFSVGHAGYRSGEAAVSVVLDRFGFSREDHEASRAVALEFYDALGTDDRMWVVSADAQPVVETRPGTARRAVAEAAGASPAATGPGSEEPGRIDRGVRVAVSNLLGEIGRRGLVVVSNGEISPRAFDDYSLAETAAHLRNNHVALSVIYTRRNVTSRELDYLAGATGGTTSYAYRPEGARAVLQEIRAQPSGSYLLVYNSVHDSDFGRRYIPLEVEAYLMQRSGRDEAGYFGPLEF